MVHKTVRGTVSPQRALPPNNVVAEIGAGAGQDILRAELSLKLVNYHTVKTLKDRGAALGGFQVFKARHLDDCPWECAAAEA